MEYYYTTKDKNPSTKSTGPVKLKVCGMNKNTQAVAALQPDYLGFIFWKPSKRYFEGNMPEIPHGIKKVGVFVDESLDKVISAVREFNLLLVQLHGQESAAYCDALKEKLPTVEIIKVFSIKDSFDFSALRHFDDVCDYYLFDTKGKLPGGNGFTFDWKVLKNYPSTKPYFLSGGIGLENVDDVLAFLNTEASKYCHAIDINSKFELAPGLKNIEALKQFKNKLATKKG